MPVLVNTQARLIWGIGKRWLPGPNPISEKDWARCLTSAGVKRMVDCGWLKYEADRDALDPMAVPTAAQLEGFTLDELRGSLASADIPPSYHPAIEAEIQRRNGG